MTLAAGTLADRRGGRGRHIVTPRCGDEPTGEGPALAEVDRDRGGGSSVAEA
jgi:hypothetical protein